MLTIKHWLRVTHRCLGLVLNLCILTWFLSGFVMMYKDFPSVSLHENLAARRPLTPSAIRVSPHTAQMQAGLDSSLLSARSGMALDRPVYWLEDAQGQTRTVYADTGDRLMVDERLAQSIAENAQKPSPAIQRIDRMTERDQWTPTADFLPHMPMYRVHLDDGPHTVLYISSATGEIVQKLNARDKLWAWLGPIPHWFYVRELRIRSGLWRQVVIWAAAGGVALCLTGLIQGALRYQRKRPGLAFSPYRASLFRWHHYTGFTFGILVFTWMLSGLLSMEPLYLSPGRSLSEPEHLRWQGGGLDLRNVRVPPGNAVEILSEYGQSPVKELRIIPFQSRLYYLAHLAGDKTLLLAADTLATEPLSGFPRRELITAVRRINPSPIAEYSLLTAYDAYYYAKNRDKPLPVLRVKMDDAPGTWYYINPQTGAVLDKYESLSRFYRWIYHGLHSWDFPQLLYRRPLWDITVVVLMTCGTGVAITGVCLFFRWTGRTLTGSFRETKDP